MILQSLAQLARDEGLLEDPDYEPKAVAVFIELAGDGRFLGFKSTAGDGGAGRPRPKVFQVPRQEKRASASKAQFLVDGAEYVLGVGDDDARAKERHALFTDRVRRCAEATGDPAVRAALGFLDRVAAGDRPPAGDDVLAAPSFSFRIDGEALFDRPAVRAYWRDQRAAPVAAEGAEVQCLVCGRPSAPALTHPAIKGVAGGNPTGTALVSFNREAFKSWGLDQGENAPVCRDCAEAYTTGLNRVLAYDYVHGDRHLDRWNVRLSADTMVGYWATGEAREALGFLTAMLDGNPEVVGRVYAAPWRGVAPRAPEGARFHALVISGAQARATVREWIESSLSEAIENIGQHFRDLDIAGLRESPIPPSLHALLRAVAVLGKVENVPPPLATGLARAALRKLPYPRALLEAAVRRVRAEGRVTPLRAALIKAVLLRSRSDANRPRHPEVKPNMDPANHDPAYLCGRLLAILEKLQGDAINNPNATLVDRFYGAASARPATVFGALLKTAQHHRAKARSGGYLNLLMGEVIANLPAFPLVLTLEEQGLFAIGYYHQRAELWKPRKPADAASPADAVTTAAPLEDAR